MWSEGGITRAEYRAESLQGASCSVQPSAIIPTPAPAPDPLRTRGGSQNQVGKREKMIEITRCLGLKEPSTAVMHHQHMGSLGRVFPP